MKKPRNKTRHFKLEWNCTREELFGFFKEVRKVIKTGAYCRARIGEVYLTVQGVENSSNLYGEMLTDYRTVEDVLHEWRKKIILLKTLSGNPKPENHWEVSWINLETIN